MHIQSLSLLPWIMLSTHQLHNKKNYLWMGILAIIINQQIFAGFPQTTFITMLFSTSYYFWLVFLSKTFQRKDIFYIISLILAIFLSAIQLLPSQEFLKNTIYPNGLPYEIASYYSFPIKNLATYIYPFIFGNPKTASYSPMDYSSHYIFWENIGYFGIFPIILILYVFLKKMIFGKKLKIIFL
jgi:hypothetical protein